MKAIDKNTSDNYIVGVYKKEAEEKLKIYSKIQFPYKIAFGNLTVNIHDIFTDEGNEDLRNDTYFHLFTILGNINGKTQKMGLYFKSKDIKDNFLSTHRRLENLSNEIKETVDYIHEFHGRPKQQHAILHCKANN